MQDAIVDEQTRQGQEGRQKETPPQPPSEPAPSEQPPSERQNGDGNEPPPQPAKTARGEPDDGQKQGTTSAAFAFVRAHPYAIGAGAFVALAIAAGATLWWLDARHYEWTDDAFIDARQFAISPKVAGYISQVFVTDNQLVQAGAPLFQIDQRDYQIALAQAVARLSQAEASVKSADAQIDAQMAQAKGAADQLRNAEAALTFARQENQRAQELVQHGNATLQRAQQTKSQLDQAIATVSAARANQDTAQQQVTSLQAQRASAVANVALASAQKAQAALNLSETKITAAQLGRVAHLTAAKGQYVQVGQNLTMLVPDPLWITANFKETEITDMRPGQPVDIEVDAYPNREFHGHVDSIQPGSGTAFSLLPAENATGNFVKVVQRVPVKIVLDDVPSDVTLGPGMSVYPSVKVR